LRFHSSRSASVIPHLPHVSGVGAAALGRTAAGEAPAATQRCSGSQFVSFRTYHVIPTLSESEGEGTGGKGGAKKRISRAALAPRSLPFASAQGRGDSSCHSAPRFTNDPSSSASAASASGH